MVCKINTWQVQKSTLKLGDLSNCEFLFYCITHSKTMFFSHFKSIQLKTSEPLIYLIVNSAYFLARARICWICYVFLNKYTKLLTEIVGNYLNHKLITTKPRIKNIRALSYFNSVSILLIDELRLLVHKS